ncbi:hypothetical protein ACP6PL_27995 [Dapis sp. BLCC M126]|uniref:hypothetical protein n=1 Tax=Dapis sp. BLCC M126 TaxID=3400189 RepID=UPI003CF50615
MKFIKQDWVTQPRFDWRNVVGELLKIAVIKTTFDFWFLTSDFVFVVVHLPKSRNKN